MKNVSTLFKLFMSIAVLALVGATSSFAQGLPMGGSSATNPLGASAPASAGAGTNMR